LLAGYLNIRQALIRELRKKIMDELRRTIKKSSFLRTFYPSYMENLFSSRKIFYRSLEVHSDTKNAGFTLIEIAVAMSVFTITLLTSVAAVSQMHLLQESGRNLSVASLHAQKVAEEIKLKADTSIGTAKNINWTTWAGTNGCNTLQNENTAVTFSSLSTNLTEVTITTTWNTKDHPMTYQIVTRLEGT